MRAFIALELHEETKAYVKKTQGELAEYIRGNYVSDMNLHLTMAFLGDITPKQALSVEQAIKNVCTECEECDISLQKLITFHKGELVAVSVKPNSSLSFLNRKLQGELALIGFNPEERSFHPHITLIRKAVYEIPFREIIKCIPVYNRPQKASKLTLYHSRLDVGMYDELFSVRLRDETASIEKTPSSD